MRGKKKLKKQHKKHKYAINKQKIYKRVSKDKENSKNL